MGAACPQNELPVRVWKRKLGTWLTIGLLFCCHWLVEAQSSQSGHVWMLRGDRAWEDGQFEEAEENYRRALERKPTAQGEFNLGNAIYRQERFEEAMAHYRRAAEMATDPQLKARAFYNLGNASFQAGDLRQSIEAYKNALRLNPDDLASRNNLALALQILKQQQQQQQQGDQQPPSDQNDQPQQQPNQPQENQPRQDQNPQQGQQPEQNQTPNPPQQTRLSKQELEQLLQIMEQEERKVLQRLQKSSMRRPPSGKIW
ncbi:MAG: hypothetical protein KatS3mg029_0621 [Saprospiraceae bacterium]|nr:MAG: hypothetical protein KatS3mg029_0621 [Saprospiraceae bacterium]